MPKVRIEGHDFWPEARGMIEDFPAAARALAGQKADERGLTGFRRTISVAYNAHRIEGYKDRFATAAMIRTAFGSPESAKELLEVFTYPRSDVGMRYQVHGS